MGKIMKKYVFFIDSLQGGGAERVVSILANKFYEMGIDVTIVKMWNSENEYSISPDIEILSPESIKIKNQILKFYITIMYCYLRVFTILITLYNKIFKKKIIITTTYSYLKYISLIYRDYLKQQNSAIAISFLIRSNIAVLLAVKNDKNVVKVFCERNFPLRPELPSNMVVMRNKLYKFANKFVFQTIQQKEYYKIGNKPSTIILNPLSMNLPARYWGIRKKEIVYFGRLAKQKRLDVLILAFFQLCQKRNDYKLHIYGNGNEKDFLCQIINELNISDKVIIDGFVKDIHSKIVDATMFVMTSSYEGVSNSLIEALALGLPCVCSDFDGGGARLLINDHNNGLIVPVGDVQSTTNAMLEIIENDELSKKLSENAIKIREKLNAESIAKEWLDFISA